MADGLEIRGPRERQYIKRLLVDDRQNVFAGAITKVKQAIARSKQGEFRGKTELADYLTADPTKSSSHARKFVKRLDENGILVKTGQELTASKPVTVYTVDKKELLQQAIDSEMYDQERDLWRYLLDKAGDF